MEPTRGGKGNLNRSTSISEIDFVVKTAFCKENSKLCWFYQQILTTLQYEVTKEKRRHLGEHLRTPAWPVSHLAGSQISPLQECGCKILKKIRELNPAIF